MASPIQPRNKIATSRFAYIDWMRGLACALMFQTHCYDSWLKPEARQSRFFMWSQMGGMLPAPIFIFVAGISVALITVRLREKGIDRNSIAKQTILRGAQILGLGLLFRVQEFVIGYRFVPWTDLLRVDVLNILGISIMLMGIFCWIIGNNFEDKINSRQIAGGIFVGAVIAMLTPPVWTTHRLRFFPWPIESYLDGVHIFAEPQSWLFPIFPWTAFAFAGLAVGFYLFSDFAKTKNVLAFLFLGAAAICGGIISIILDRSAVTIYSVHDYWHTSPNYFLMRCAVLVIILCFAYFWCRWGFGEKGFSPLIQLGKASLLVYWVHIEFVYGLLSILPKKRCSIPLATLGLVIIFVSMVALSLARTNWKLRASRKRSAEAAG
ncbi:MAG TPA: heparan-alpha-glucosaminide N-acetyltransferase domain-containing protein [Candidatus Dormibacteraeota bacterium]|nr:heparan-alpha-glucosaminide N-acetyltransferase domain-containing protein [Candidatus Dormibacteraeota bacterium]